MPDPNKIHIDFTVNDFMEYIRGKYKVLQLDGMLVFLNMPTGDRRMDRVQQLEECLLEVLDGVYRHFSGNPLSLLPEWHELSLKAQTLLRNNPSDKCPICPSYMRMEGGAFVCEECSYEESPPVRRIRLPGRLTTQSENFIRARDGVYTPFGWLLLEAGASEDQLSRWESGDLSVCPIEFVMVGLRVSKELDLVELILGTSQTTDGLALLIKFCTSQDIHLQDFAIAG
jgi:hypothetical protein